MDVLRCSAAREWARRVVGRWWSGDLSGLLDAGGGGEVGDGDGLVAVGAWRAWPEPAAELVALLAALAAEVAGVACGALVDTGRAGRWAGWLARWGGGAGARRPGGRRPSSTGAGPRRQRRCRRPGRWSLRCRHARAPPRVRVARSR